MADAKPRNQDKSDAGPQASAAPQDHYAVLMKVINDVSRDHAMLRKLVYALAWQNLRPEQIVLKPIADAQSQSKTIFELEQSLQLEAAIDRIEVEAVQHERKPAGRPRAPASAAGTRARTKPEPVESVMIFEAADDFSPARRAECIPVSPPPQPEPAPPVGPAKDLDGQHLAAKKPAVAQPPVRTSLAQDPVGRELVERELIERDSKIEALDAEPPRAGGAVVVVPQRSNGERFEVVQLERIPSWLEPSVRVSLATLEYGPVHRPPERRSNLFPFLQLVAASVIGVVLYIGISGWVYYGRPPGSAPAPVQQQAAGPAPAAEPSLLAAARPAPEPQPILPFPLPGAFGVYAGIPGQLFALEPLPIKVPDPRVLVSAEITKPSGVTVPGDNLSFVVYRRDLGSSAPQTVNVRVVAQVQRTTKFVDGKPAIVPLEGIWRIRAKGYEFKVSPLEGHNEMVVIQPDPGFAFAPGRYALVLNGFGYDFTVAGKVTSPEQCLQQVQVMNGAAVSECPKA
jgi:hypothetical protein